MPTILDALIQDEIDRFHLNENVTGAADEIGVSDIRSVLSKHAKGGMTTINAEYHISYLNEHYLKPLRMMQLTVTSLSDMPSRYLTL